MTRDDIKSIRMSVGTWGKVLGYCSVTFTTGMTFDSIKILAGKDGRPWVAFPQIQKKDKDQNLVWQNTVSFEDEDTKEFFKSEILRKYEDSKKAADRGQSSGPKEESTPDTSKSSVSWL